MPASNPTPVPPAASDNSIPAPAVPANYPPVAPPAPPAVAVPVPAVPVPAVPISNAPVAAPQPANAAPLQALPANNPIAAPPATANLSTFRDAIWTGYRATQTKQWQFALVAFRAALPLAQTPKELNYTQHWVHYTCVQMGIPATPVPPLSSAAPPASAPSVLSMNVPASPTTAQQVSAPPVAIPLVPAPAAPATQASAPKPTPTATPIELSAFHAYKSLKWGSPLAQFMKLKKAKGPIEKNGVSQGFGTDQTQLSLPIDLLLSNFKGAPEADLLNIYSKKEDVYYLFYQNKFAMVAGVLSNGSYPEILRQFKEKFKTIKSFDHSAQDEFGLNYKVEYEQFESSNGVSAYLIKNTRDYSGQTVVDTLFVYVPKDQLEEIQSVTLEKIKKESTTQNKRRDPDIEKDIKKL